MDRVTNGIGSSADHKHDQVRSESMSMFTIWALFGITQVEFFILLVMQIRTGDRLEVWVEWLKAIWKKREE